MNTQTFNSTTTIKQSQQNYSMQECIENCLHCFKTCEEALAKSIKASNSDHLVVLRSCSEICQTSAKFMIMNSPFHHLTCGACAEVCQRCADACEESGESYLQECVEACRKCADSCGEMSQSSH